MTDQNIPPQENRLKEIERLLFAVLRKWYLVVFALIMSLFVAFIINRYTPRIYNVETTLVSKSWKDRGNALSKVLKKGNIIYKTDPDIQQEIALIKSEENFIKTIKELDFEISYYASGNILTKEIYRSQPFFIIYDETDLLLPYAIKFDLQLESNKFYISSEDKKWAKILPKTALKYGENLSFEGFNFSISPNPSFKKEPSYIYSFTLNKLETLVNQYRNAVNVKWVDKNSSLIQIQMQSTLPEKDNVFLKKFLHVVIQTALEEKYEYATNTIKFIDEQLFNISDSLFTFDTKVDSVRLSNRDAIKGTDYIFEKLDDLSIEQADLKLKNRYYSNLWQYIDKKKKEDIFAPSIIGIDDPLLNQYVKNYIGEKLDGRLFKNEDNKNNPLVNIADAKRFRLEDNMKESIENLKKLNSYKVDEINTKIDFYLSSISDFQYASTEVRQLQRVISFNEMIYNSLLENKIEANIAIASTTSDYKVLSEPKWYGIPISPDTKGNYNTALFLGLVLPIAFIVFKEKFNPKVRYRDDITKNIEFPIIGYVGHSTIGDKLIIKERPKSLLSESLRAIRANLEYYLEKNNESKVLLISSSLSGEGKSFTSVNMAALYAVGGKKTILVGADLRRPTISRYFNTDKKVPGLSNYLVGSSKLEEIVYKTELENLSFLPAGEIPPNPFELLAKPEMGNLIENLKKAYDFVLIDTPPLLLVSDSFNLFQFSNVNILIVRHNSSFKASLKAVEEMKKEGQIKDFTIVYNDVDENFSRYGYGYGRYRYGGYKYKYGGYRYSNHYGSYYEQDSYYEDNEGEPKKTGIFSFIKKSLKQK